MTHVDAIVGIDVGATGISGAVVTPDGDVVVVEQRATHGRGKGTAVETLTDVVDIMLAEGRARGLHLAGIGIGLPGPVDLAAGAMAAHPRNHVPEFGGVSLRDRLTLRTGLPVFVDNDVNALALAEREFGAARGASSAVLLAIGTEIGGAILVGDTLVRGHSSFAGELGHVPINFRGPRCICGGRGCASLYVGGRVMARAAQRRAARARSKLVAMAGGDPRAITSELVFEAARLDDPLAHTLVDQACEALGALVGVIVNGIDPEVIVITGGVATSLEPLRDTIVGHAACYAHAIPLARTRVEIVSGDKTRTVRGGAALVLCELRRAAGASLDEARTGAAASPEEARTIPQPDRELLMSKSLKDCES
jgi:glucokinase